MTRNPARAVSLVLALALAGCRLATIHATVLDVTISINASAGLPQDYFMTPSGAAPNAMPASRNAARTRALTSRRSSN